MRRKYFLEGCVCVFLFLDDEFSATALLSEAARIKNTYTDGTKFYAYRIKYATSPTRVFIINKFRKSS